MGQRKSRAGECFGSSLHDREPRATRWAVENTRIKEYEAILGTVSDIEERKMPGYRKRKIKIHQVG